MEFDVQCRKMTCVLILLFIISISIYRNSANALFYFRVHIVCHVWNGALKAPNVHFQNWFQFSTEAFTSLLNICGKIY